MASGKQLGDENVAAFASWCASKSDQEFCEYVHKGKLNRSEIATECGFSRSVLQQNPAVRKALLHLEEELRQRGVLPPHIHAALSGDLPARNKEVNQRWQDSQRVLRLEHENASLRAELQEAKDQLKQFSRMRQFLEETGRLPR